MTEFFKKNPMALRHCLLYEYLRKTRADQSFTVFRMTVGPGVIKKKRFYFWFRRFKKGVFDINEEKPITDMREVLRSDKYALRACILYESLKYKLIDRGFSIRSLWPNSKLSVNEIRSNPSFAMYNNFCKVIGKDVMEYREFDFWFYRFFNGDVDLNFEQDKNQKILEISDMPIDIMKNIVEYLDIFDRMKLAKTSRSLHTFVEDQKLSHHTLQLRISNYFTNVSLGESNNFQYIWSKTGCKRRFKKRETRVRGLSHWQQAFLDLKKILINPRFHLDYFGIQLAVDSSLKNVFNDLEAALKFPHYLNVETLFLEKSSWNQFSRILPSLKPGYLKTIHIISHDPNANSIRKVFKMEQWKRAKRFYMEGSFIWPLHHLYHFEVFNVTVKKLSVEDIRRMRETLLKSLTFEECSIKVNDAINVNAIEEEFGDFMLKEDVSEYMKIYHYPIPYSTEYFEIKVQRWAIEITRKKAQ